MPILRSRNRIWKPQPLDNENGLVGWWPFGDGSGLDISGHGLAGALNGTPNPIFDNVGWGLNFNGSSQYVQVAHNASLIPAAISICAWIKPPNSNQFGPIVQKLGSNDLYSLSVDADVDAASTGKNIGFAVATAGFSQAREYDTSTAVADGNLHRVIATYDSVVDAMFIYVDGLSRSLTSRLVVGSPPVAVNTNPVYIGRNNGGTFFYTGTMRDVRIYNRALTPAEVNADYNSALSMYCRQDEWEMPLVKSSGFPWWAVGNNQFVVGTGVQ